MDDVPPNEGLSRRLAEAEGALRERGAVEARSQEALSALQQSEAPLASDLAGLRRFYEFNARLATEPDRIRVGWRERGVATPNPGSAPVGAGQGRELIERALPYKLNPTARYEFLSDDVHCAISLRVSASSGEGDHDHG